MGWMLNQGKGRFAELFKRVDGNDPSTSVIVLVPLSASGTEGGTQDDDDLATFLAGTPNEATGSTWARKVLTDSDLSAPAPDDANNRYPATLPAQTWSGVAAGNDTTGLAVCYDPVAGSGTDSEIVVLGVLDFVVETDGNDVVMNSGDFARAS